MANTTQKHFEMFKKEFLRWVDRYGLTGWKLDFEHGMSNYNSSNGNEDRDGGANAWLKIHSVTGRLATVGLSEEVDDVKDIKQYAFHEASELLLARLCFIAEARYCQQSEIEEERHNLIRILENVLFN